MESKKIFNFVEEHQSHKCMVMSEQEYHVFPCVNSIDLLPNIVDLQQLEESTDHNSIDLREEYGKIVLLLFYPYRTQDDLKLNGSYWKKYQFVISNNILSKKSLEVCQNI